MSDENGHNFATRNHLRSLRLARVEAAWQKERNARLAAEAERDELRARVAELRGLSEDADSADDSGTEGSEDT